MLHGKQLLIRNIYGKEPETLDEIAEACIAVINATDSVLGFAWDIKYDKAVSNSHYAPIAGVTNWGGRNEAAKGVRNYPGFSGRVWIRYADENEETFGSSGNFTKTLTYPGSGGWGAYEGIWAPICSASYQSQTPRRPGQRGPSKRKYPEPRCFSWDFRIFLTDFPLYAEKFNAIMDTFNQEVEWDLLKSRHIHSTFALTHRFAWEDPDTKAADDAFIKKFNKKKKMDPKNNPRHEPA